MDFSPYILHKREQIFLVQNFLFLQQLDKKLKQAKIYGAMDPIFCCFQGF